MTTPAPLPTALPRARQAWPLPYGPDVVAFLETALPSVVDEDNEVLLARVTSPPASPGTAA